MDITIKQFKQTLRRVVKDEINPIENKMATKKQVEGLTVSVDGLAKTVDSYLNKEWNVHLHDIHPRLDNRLTQIERKLTN